jgi:hypothetical protein
MDKFPESAIKHKRTTNTGLVSQRVRAEEVRAQTEDRRSQGCREAVNESLLEQNLKSYYRFVGGGDLPIGTCRRKSRFQMYLRC